MKKPRLTTLIILVVFLLLSPNTMFCKPLVSETGKINLPPSEHEGVYLVINKANNTLKVYLNDYLVYQFRVGTGKNKSLTPEGTFKIITKIKEPWYLPKDIAGGDPKNPLGTRWMGLNVPETNGYKFGIHGTNNPWSIGKYVSQGCIRMRNQDIEWLFRHIPLQTEVFIIDDPKR